MIQNKVLLMSRFPNSISGSAALLAESVWLSVRAYILLLVSEGETVT